MDFFERRLRLEQHDDPDVLFQDAVHTLTELTNTRDPAIALVAGFLLHAPSKFGQSSIAQDIVTLREPIEAEYWKTVDEAPRYNPFRWAIDERNASLHATDLLLGGLQALADHYNKAILEPFIGIKRRVIPENPCWDGDLSTMMRVEPTKRKGMRKEIIERDNYRCCVTGRLDLDIADLDAAEQADIMSEGPYVPGNLDCLQVAHIFPYSINKFNARKVAEVKRAKIIWTAFRDFSGFDLDDLIGPGINEETNLLMLAPVAHKLFDRLELWFNPVQDPVTSHEIEVDPRYEAMLSTLGEVDLDTRVDPRWLAIHRSLCLISKSNEDYRNEALQLKPDEDDDIWL